MCYYGWRPFRTWVSTSLWTFRCTHRCTCSLSTGCANCGDLHSLCLDEVEDVPLGGCGDVEPDTGHQMAERAASWEVRAPPDVQPLPQHLENDSESRSIEISLRAPQTCRNTRESSKDKNVAVSFGFDHRKDKIFINSFKLWPLTHNSTDGCKRHHSIPCLYIEIGVQKTISATVYEAAFGACALTSSLRIVIGSTRLSQLFTGAPSPSEKTPSRTPHWIHIIIFQSWLKLFHTLAHSLGSFSQSGSLKQHTAQRADVTNARLWTVCGV